KQHKYTTKVIPVVKLAQIGNLPIECVIQVLKHLDTQKLLQLRLCKSWKAAVENICKKRDTLVLNLYDTEEWNDRFSYRCFSREIVDVEYDQFKADEPANTLMIGARHFNYRLCDKLSCLF